MSDKKQYKKCIKKYQKKLIKIAKSTYPWDYFYSIEFTIEHLKMMKEYYDIGYNVWSCDEDLDERRRIIDNLLYEYDAYNELPRNEREEIAKELNVEVDKIEDNFNRIETEYTISLKGKETKCSGMRFEDKNYPREIWSKYVSKIHESEEKHFNNFMDMFKGVVRMLSD